MPSLDAAFMLAPLSLAILKTQILWICAGRRDAEAREVLDVDVPTRQLACPARLINTNCSANPAPAMEKEAILVGDSSQLDAEGKRN